MAGVFAAGDMRSGSIKRVASAVGEGSMAVRLVHQYLADADFLQPFEAEVVRNGPLPVLARGRFHGPLYRSSGRSDQSQPVRARSSCSIYQPRPLLPRACHDARHRSTTHPTKV
jgi:hypothetical protein